LSSTQAIFRGLQESLQDSLHKLPDNTPPRLKDSLIKAHHKLSDYYTKFDKSPLCVWSSHNSISFLVKGLSDDCSDYTLQVHLDNEKEQLHQYYQDNYLAPQASPITPEPTTAETVFGSPQKVDFMAQYKKRPMNLKDELEEYYRLPLEDFDTCDPIQWWEVVVHSFQISRVWLGIFLLFLVQLLLSSEFFWAAAILFPFGKLVSNLTLLGH
ncbi:hypothetical protein K503DRAFT_815280, partial [Rhizopogon vinicolor AM-OR11-026]